VFLLSVKGLHTPFLESSLYVKSRTTLSEMEMTLSKRGDYVVRAALCLARAYDSGEHRKIREVVAEMDVPQTYASQILAALVHANLAVSKAGRGGGYRLVRDPRAITLLDIVEAGEGPLRAERCALGVGPCRWDAVCPLHETWGAATSALRETLAQTSLAALVTRDRELEAGDYPVPFDSHRPGTLTFAIDDSVHVEASTATVIQNLNTASSWLPSCVKKSYAQAEAIRQSIDPSGLTWIPRSITVLAASDPSSQSTEKIRVTWEAGGAPGPASRFEGQLELSTIDPDRTQLRLHGIFRPPPQAAEGDASLTDRLSRATVRSAMREIAHTIETTTHPRHPETRRATAL
jgi:Rrf2 family protein